jgi:hypothetical protein
MAKKFKNTDPYSATTDQMWAMLSDQGYWTAKYEALGASNIVWEKFEASDDKITMKSVRDVPADLPGFAKKVIGETNVVTQEETYVRSGDTINQTIQINVKGAPGGTTGTMQIRPVGSGVEWSADFDIKVSVPMVGGKLEGIMQKETASNFVQEKQFNDNYLATH